jgi:CMP-N-acetylneuraminic acid synthetase
MNEYFFFKNKPLNFNYKEELKSRRKIKSLKKIVPAVTIIKSSKNSNIKNIFKDKNYFFEIDWLESLEINTPKDLDVFNLLIKEYLKKI